MNRVAKRTLVREIERLNLPIDINIKYFNEDTNDVTNEIVGHVVYVYFKITPDVCPKLKKIYETSIYFLFGDNYPYSPPKIYLEDIFNHPLLNDESVILCDYYPGFGFGQLIMNTYCIILEALNKYNNDKFIDYINKPI